MLTKDEVLIMREAMNKSGSPPAQVALQKGYLDAAQIDIIETLLHPNDTVPGYEIIDVLGQGGMGVVYRARQLNLSRIVAIKTILLSRMSDKSTAGRFAKEAQTIGKLRHPNIIAAYDFGQYEGRLFLSMELVEGEDVDALLQDRGRLDELTAWTLARQAAAGLAHADRLGVVHRDIKPANLLLVDPPEGFPLPKGQQMVKVADFGLAFLADDQQVHTRLTSDNSAVGSPHYMAPEQLTDLDVDFRADIYALGATVYHMLSGRPPFGGLNLSQIIAQKLSGEFKTLNERCPDVSQPSCHLVAKMLAREPNERHTDYETLLDDIDEVIQSVTPSSGPNARVDTGSDTGTRTGVISAQDTQTMPSPDVSTEKSPKVSLRTSSGRRGEVWAIAASVVVLAVGFAAWRFASSSAPPPSPERTAMRDTGWITPLFLGTSLTGWTNRSGNWITGQDNEGGFVIVGTGGVIERRLLKEGTDGQPVPMEFYRIDLSVQQNEASAVEVHFGLMHVDGFDGPRYAMRIDSEGVVLGMRSSDLGTFVPRISPMPLPEGSDKPHAIRVERQPSAWFVTIDGQDLPGLPSLTAELAESQLGDSFQELRPEPLPEFRLKVEGGPAWFSDISIEELELPTE